MATREKSGDRGRRRGERLLDDLIREARDARLARNLSQRAVGQAIGLSDSRISIIESGGYADIPFVALARLLAVVGLDLSARAYPVGGGLRDVAQVNLLERLRVRVAHGFAWRTEVVMPIPGDLRAWDAALFGEALRIGVDAETRLRDVQAVDRRAMLKLRDSGFDRAILLVAATRNNGLAIREAGSSLRGNYPIPARIALQALSAGHDPGGNSLIVLWESSPRATNERRARGRRQPLARGAEERSCQPEISRFGSTDERIRTPRPDPPAASCVRRRPRPENRAGNREPE